MNYPIPELITQNVVEVLEQVQLASGYGSSLKIERFKKGGGNSHDDLTAVVGFDDDDLAATDDTPIGFTSWIRPYWVIVFIYEGSESMPYDQRLDIIRADIEKALMQDVTRGGHAQNTFIAPPERFDPANDATGVIVNFNVHYRHDETDPYSLTPTE